MCVSVIFRWHCSPKACNEAVQALKRDKKVELVDWCPTGFKISMIDKMPSYLGDDGLKPTDKQCVMIGNNVTAANQSASWTSASTPGTWRIFDSIQCVNANSKVFPTLNKIGTAQREQLVHQGSGFDSQC